MAAIADSRSSRSDLRIRIGSDDDVPGLTRLINAAFVVEQAVFDGNRVDDLGVRAYMSGGTFLVAEDSGGLAGSVYVATRGDRRYRGVLSVPPTRHGALLRRHLLAAAERLAP